MTPPYDPSLPRPRRHRGTTVLAVALLAALAGCGGDSASTTASSRTAGPVIVSAATSLKTALTAYGERFDGGTTRLSFAGSDELAAQIRQGVKPDVYAAANTTLPEQLFAEGLLERPRAFATNELVLAVPADGAKVRSLDDLDDATLAVGAKGVPVGEYTRKVLARLPAAQRAAIQRGVRSEEPDVGGIVGKLTQGAVDAGFVYRSDVQAAGGRLRAIALPERLKPAVVYGVALVKGGENPAGGRAFVDGLLRGSGADALRAAGFGPAP